MADSTGIDAGTGQLLTDWTHTEQSIRKVLTTALSSRVMLRDFGSAVPDHVDHKLTSRTVLSLYVAAATALRRWCPRFRMTGGAVLGADVGGVFEIVVSGIYYPRGHRGDFSVAEDASVRVVIGAAL